MGTACLTRTHGMRVLLFDLTDGTQVRLVFFFFSSTVTNEGRAVKNYAVHQSLEDPGSASQQSECNDPAPH